MYFPISRHKEHVTGLRMGVWGLSTLFGLEMEDMRGTRGGGSSAM